MGGPRWHRALACAAKAIDRARRKKQKTRCTNQALDADIMGLKSGDQALEEQARFELGMVKEGEVYYQFIDG